MNYRLVSSRQQPIERLTDSIDVYKRQDLVSGEGHITCGKCRNCLEGHKENCKDAKGVGVNRNGAFAEYLVIPSSNVWPCNPNIPEEMYAIFDPFGNATHTALSYDCLLYTSCE